MKQLCKSLSRTNDGAFLIDARHRIIFWNQAAEEILGFTAKEVIGRQCYEILGGQDERGRILCNRYCRVAIHAERGDVLPNRDVSVKSGTGEELWLNVTTFAYDCHEKSVNQVIVHLFRDVTAIKNDQRFVCQILDASQRLRQNGDFQTISIVPTRTVGDMLTAREWQVLLLMAQGLGTGEMAGSMTISPSTVRNHVQNILDKLGVHSRLEAVAHAYQHGLIESV